MIEWFVKRSQRNNHPDPTKASILSPRADELYGAETNEYGNRVLTDDVGRRFHQIVKRPEDQMFLSRLLKGVFPVSDVVFTPVGDYGKFYSYEMPLSDIGSDESYDRQHAEVDCKILEIVFSDSDHVPKGRWYLGENINEQNVRSEGSKTAFFDFSIFPPMFEIDLNLFEFSPDEYIRQISKRIQSVARSSRKTKLALLRLNQLEEQIGGTSGLQYLRAIVTSLSRSGVRPPSILRTMKTHKPNAEPIESFQEEILRRIKIFRNVIA